MNEPTPRIKCTRCETMILPVTAEHNDGLCGHCHRMIRDAPMIEKQQEELRRHRAAMVRNPDFYRAKLKDLDWGDMSADQMGDYLFLERLRQPRFNLIYVPKRCYVRGLKTFINLDSDDLHEIASDFLGYSESLLFSRWSLWRGLCRLPHPYRKLLAAYQAWGMISSDGFYNYLSDTNEKYDAQAQEGYKLLGMPDASELIAEVRKLYTEGAEGYDDSGSEYLDRFFDLSDSFEEQLGLSLKELLQRQR